MSCGKAQTRNLKGSLPRIHPSDASDQWKHQTLKSAILIIRCIYLPVGETCLKTVLVILFLHNLMLLKIKLKQLMVVFVAAGFHPEVLQQQQQNGSDSSRGVSGGDHRLLPKWVSHPSPQELWGKWRHQTLSHMRQSHQCFPVREIQGKEWD